MVTKGIYLFWDKKYEQVIYAGRFTGRQRIKDHFRPSLKHRQKINGYVQNHPDRIESVIFCEFDDISNDDLNQMEFETIKLFKLNKYRYPDSHVFNFTDGGDGASGYITSEETKKKISEANTGKIRTEETKKKISKNHAKYWEGKTLSDEHKQKVSENHADFSGENHPNAKYTLWNIAKCGYNKKNMFLNGNAGINPRRCFTTKYNGKHLPIGTHLDFYTPELINDLINESLEVN